MKTKRKRTKKVPTVEIVPTGFTRRVKRPKRQGKKVKSVMIRVDAGFADWCRKQAETSKSITEVTRVLHQRILEGEEMVRKVALARGDT